MMNPHASPEVTIRPVELADAAILATLMCQLGYETRAAEMEMRLHSILPDSRYRTFVAVVEGQVCGMIGTFCHHSYEHNDPSARILVLVVAEALRGRGVGRVLVRAAEADLAARNITRLALNTRLTRKEAHLFYERLRYEKNGFRFFKTLSPQAD
jgi:GNAT superfamily N-acetyltransferase